MCYFCFFNVTATTAIYTYYLTLSLHEALPIYLRLPPRTLQRRLEELQQCHTGMVRHIRCDAACAMLKDPALSVARIEARLGLEYPLNFNRASRNWAGVSPKRWRHRFKESTVSRRRVRRRDGRFWHDPDLERKAERARSAPRIRCLPARQS